MKSKVWQVALHCLVSKDARGEAVAVAILLKRECLNARKKNNIKGNLSGVRALSLRKTHQIKKRLEVISIQKK